MIIRRLGVAIASVAVLGGLAACAADATTTAESTAAIRTGTPTQTAAPATATAAVPSNCDDLYSSELRTLISPDGLLTLNPAWMSEPGNERKQENGYGSFDPQLISQLTQKPGLLCDWAKASGGGEVFITTQVRSIDSASGDSAVARMRELGWACGDDLGGIWCTTEAQIKGVLMGESHLIRDGLWIATDWANAGPQGYMAALAKEIFG